MTQTHFIEGAGSGRKKASNQHHNLDWWWRRRRWWWSRHQVSNFDFQTIPQNFVFKGVHIPLVAVALNNKITLW